VVEIDQGQTAEYEKYADETAKTRIWFRLRIRIALQIRSL
jgi:hypothetical protein